VLPELDEQGLVQEVLHVLVVVERGGGGGALVGAFLVQRFAGVDACSASVSIQSGATVAVRVGSRAWSARPTHP
jgi:hypothetical protein